MNFSGMTLVHNAHVRIAADLTSLEMLLLVEKRIEVLATQNVLLLLERDTAGKTDLQRLLLE